MGDIFYADNTDYSGDNNYTNKTIPNCVIPIAVAKDWKENLFPDITEAIENAKDAIFEDYGRRNGKALLNNVFGISGKMTFGVNNMITIKTIDNSKNETDGYALLIGNTFPDLVKKTIINPPATIIYWQDGSKTVAKCSENDVFDPRVGLAMCIVKKLFMNHSTPMNKWFDEQVGDFDNRYLVQKAYEKMMKKNLEDSGWTIREEK